MQADRDRHSLHLSIRLGLRREGMEHYVHTGKKTGTNLEITAMRGNGNTTCNEAIQLIKCLLPAALREAPVFNSLRGRF